MNSQQRRGWATPDHHMSLQAKNRMVVPGYYTVLCAKMLYKPYHQNALLSPPHQKTKIVKDTMITSGSGTWGLHLQQHGGVHCKAIKVEEISVMNNCHPQLPSPHSSAIHYRKISSILAKGYTASMQLHHSSMQAYRKSLLAATTGKTATAVVLNAQYGL